MAPTGPTKHQPGRVPWGAGKHVHAFREPRGEWSLQPGRHCAGIRLLDSGADGSDESPHERMHRLTPRSADVWLEHAGDPKGVVWELQHLRRHAGRGRADDHAGTHQRGHGLRGESETAIVPASEGLVDPTGEARAWYRGDHLLSLIHI